HSGRRIDWRGISLLSAGATSLLVGCSWGGTEHPGVSVEVMGSISAGALLLGWFWHRDRRAADPVVPRAEQHGSSIRLANIAAVASGIALLAPVVSIPLLQQAALAS